jgi:outer membrane protein
LLDFGGRDAQANLAWQLLLAANWQHDLVMQQVMLSVLDAYTSYEGNKALVEADAQNLKDAQVALEGALKMRKAGLATMTDVLSVQSSQEQARFNLEQAKGAEKTALGQLLIALGLPADTKLSVNDLPQKSPGFKLDGCLNIMRFSLAMPRMIGKPAAPKVQ